MSISHAIEKLARWLAILGGLALVAMIAMTVVSIVGRSLIGLGLGPVPGDFELVEVGTGFAVFAFLPWCQLKRGHATVDVFTAKFSRRANRLIDLATDLLLTLTIIVVAWRLWLGMMDKIRYNETTFILQFPVWWGFAAAMVAAAGGVIVSVYMLAVRFEELRRDTDLLPPHQEAEH